VFLGCFSLELLTPLFHCSSVQDIWPRVDFLSPPQSLSATPSSLLTPTAVKATGAHLPSQPEFKMSGAATTTIPSAELHHAAADLNDSDPDCVTCNNKWWSHGLLPARAPCSLVQPIQPDCQEKGQYFSVMQHPGASGSDDGGRTAHKQNRQDSLDQYTVPIEDRVSSRVWTAAAMCSIQGTCDRCSSGGDCCVKHKDASLPPLEKISVVAPTQRAEAMHIVFNHSTPGGHDNSSDSSTACGDISACRGTQSPHPNLSSDHSVSGTGASAAMVLVTATLRETAAAVGPNNLPQLHADISAHPSTLQRQESYPTSGGSTEVVRGSEEAKVGAGRVPMWGDADGQMGKDCPVQLQLWRAIS
jgi:hypothetical protein